MSGFTDIDGLYELTSDTFNDNLVYIRTEPTVMYAYKNAVGNYENWHLFSTLGDSVSEFFEVYVCYFSFRAPLYGLRKRMLVLMTGLLTDLVIMETGWKTQQ